MRRRVPACALRRRAGERRPEHSLRLPGRRESGRNRQDNPRRAEFRRGCGRLYHGRRRAGGGLFRHGSHEIRKLFRVEKQARGAVRQRAPRGRRGDEEVRGRRAGVPAQARERRRADYEKARRRGRVGLSAESLVRPDGGNRRVRAHPLSGGRKRRAQHFGEVA